MYLYCELRLASFLQQMKYVNNVTKERHLERKFIYEWNMMKAFRRLAFLQTGFDER